MRKVISLMVLILVLPGCEARENFAYMPPNDLCEKAVDRGWMSFDSDIQAEVFDRGLIKIGDWERIKSGRIQKGMSDCAAVAILGLPGKVARKPYVVGKDNRAWFYGKGKNRSLLYVLDIKWGEVHVCRRPKPGSDKNFLSC